MSANKKSWRKIKDLAMNVHRKTVAEFWGGAPLSNDKNAVYL